MKPAVWQVLHVPNTSHTSLMPLWTGNSRQKEFWIEIGEWLERVDEAREDLHLKSTSNNTRPSAVAAETVPVKA